MQTLDRGISAPQQVVGRCHDASLTHQPLGIGPTGFSGFVGVANILRGPSKVNRRENVGKGAYRTLAGRRDNRCGW